jgi:hypothetical protein
VAERGAVVPAQRHQISMRSCGTRIIGASSPRS